MHYSSHPPCAFRNRIARYLGVLVGAALVATLGLPSAVQAQTTGAPMVEYADDTDAFTVSRPHAMPSVVLTHDHWVLEVDGPVSVADMVMMTAPTTSVEFTVQAKGNDGDWMFRLATGAWDTWTDEHRLMTQAHDDD